MAHFSTLDPQEVLSDLEALAGNLTPALLCFEKPNESEAWYHRSFVSALMKDGLGLDVFGFGLEDLGAGLRHPKLPRLAETDR